MTHPDTGWQDDAACRTTSVDFFPRAQNTYAIKRAQRICADCPVASECLEYAEQTGQQYGIWGGQLREAPRAPQDVGDLSGHYKSTRRTCGWCGAPFTGYGVMKYCCYRCRLDAKAEQNRMARERRQAAG